MRRVPVRKGGRVVAHALVDDQDYELVGGFRWGLNRGGYAWTTLSREAPGGRYRLMHRVVFGLEPGDGRELDHRNRNPLDNRRSNLRLSTTALNAQNRAHPGGSSPYRGVTWHRQCRKWQATVKLAGRSHYLGLFDDEREAARVARDFRAEYMPYAEAA